MTQPAKVQEPSMEEILASIRRIIADDEAKPPSRVASAPARPEKPAASSGRPATNEVSPARIAPKASPASPSSGAPTASGSNSQDDIDALLAGLDEATSPAEVRPSPSSDNPETDVLELTDEMAVAAPPLPPQQPAFRKVEPRDDLEFAESAAKSASRQSALDQPSYDALPQQPILSQRTVSAVESAFNALAHTVLSNNARTLEDLVKEMLRPMLKAWLDDNLPGLVERIVKAEIERVSRGR